MHLHRIIQFLLFGLFACSTHSTSQFDETVLSKCVCVCSPNHRFWGWGWYDELRYYDTVFYQTDDLTNQNRKKINGISFPKMSKPVLGMYDMYPYGVPLLGTNNLDVQRSEFAENLSNNWQCVVLSQVNLWERPVWQGPQQGPVI